SFCGVPCVLAKLAHGTPYLLTEHGVYLREQYLNLRRQVESFVVRWFLYRVIENVVELNYYFADLVAPVCAFNSRWEKHLGVPQSQIGRASCRERGSMPVGGGCSRRRDVD